MAGKIKHRYPNPVPQGAGFGPPTGGVGPNQWNDSLIVVEGNNGDVLMRDSTQGDGWRWDAGGSGHGQGRLIISGGLAVLIGVNGNQMRVGGKQYSLPAAGVSKGSGGLSNSTTYYTYLFDNAGTLELEFSATGYAIDTTSGIAIKTADATRTFVGLVRTTAAGAFVDSANQMFVNSYFNPRMRTLKGHYTVTRTTTSTGYAEPSTEIRIEFLSLTHAVRWSAAGMANISAGNPAAIAVGFDGVTAEEPSVAFTGTGASNFPWGCSGSKVLADGYHFLTLLGKAFGGAGTLSLVTFSDVAGERTSLDLTVVA